METQPTPQQPQNGNTSTNFELYGKTRLGILIVGVLVLATCGRMCAPKKPTTPANTLKVLPVRVVLNNPSKKTSLPSHYVPPEGGVIITPTNPNQNLSDIIKVHYKEIGFTFEPGIQTVLFSEPNLGLDAKLIYAYRFGFNIGFVAGKGLDLNFSPTASISYRLDQLHLKNTELFVGYVPLSKLNIQMGFRINL